MMNGFAWRAVGSSNENHICKKALLKTIFPVISDEKKQLLQQSSRNKNKLKIETF